MHTNFLTLKELIVCAVEHEFKVLVDSEIKKMKLYLEEEYKETNEKLVNKIYDKFMEEMRKK